MHICNAMTQGQMGYILQQTLMNELKSYNLNFNVVTMITQVLVDRHDPDFQHPSKPVGPFYDPATKEKLESEKGWRMKKVRSPAVQQKGPAGNLGGSGPYQGADRATAAPGSSPRKNPGKSFLRQIHAHQPFL
jgi:hypothetical protein